MVHARFLAPLVKARSFGMTIFKIGTKLTQYSNIGELSLAFESCLQASP